MDNVNRTVTPPRRARSRAGQPVVLGMDMASAPDRVATLYAEGDPRNAATLGEACDNGDGTYNGFRLLSWLSGAMSPGAGLSEAEVRDIVSEAQARRQRVARD